MNCMPTQCYLCHNKFIDINQSINKMLRSSNTTLILYCYNCKKSLYYIYSEYFDKYMYLGKININ